MDDPTVPEDAFIVTPKECKAFREKLGLTQEEFDFFLALTPGSAKLLEEYGFDSTQDIGTKVDH